MKLSHFAKLNGITYKTAHKRFKTGKILGAFKNEKGTIIVPDSFEHILLSIYANGEIISKIREFIQNNGWNIENEKSVFMSIDASINY